MFHVSWNKTEYTHFEVPSFFVFWNIESSICICWYVFQSRLFIFSFSNLASDWIIQNESFAFEMRAFWNVIYMSVFRLSFCCCSANVLVIYFVLSSKSWLFSYWFPFSFFVACCTENEIHNKMMFVLVWFTSADHNQFNIGLGFYQCSFILSMLLHNLLEFYLINIKQ